MHRYNAVLSIIFYESYINIYQYILTSLYLFDRGFAIIPWLRSASFRIIRSSRCSGNVFSFWRRSSTRATRVFHRKKWEPLDRPTGAKSHLVYNISWQFAKILTFYWMQNLFLQRHGLERSYRAGSGGYAIHRAPWRPRDRDMDIAVAQ